MKLPYILAKYLFTYNELNLAGIGRFLLENPGGEAEISEKNTKDSTIIIKFFQDVSVKEEDKLVAFISTHSGKMKSLAASDLESFLEQAKEFMNIGKPFLLEGIGTLVKMKPGKFEFIPANFVSEKIKETLAKEPDQSFSSEDIYNDFSDTLTPKKPQTPASKKIVLLLAILAGLALAVWGIFILYKNYYLSEKPSVEISQPILLTDTTSITKIDTTTKKIIDTSTTISYYKFIIEQADSLRAFARFNYLKKLGIKIEMETTDSILFKLYFRLAALPADTSRIRDSLNLNYGTKGKTLIE